MPLLVHNALPAYDRLARTGVPVAPLAAWTGPLLRVGVVNTMADAALEATERQVLGLLAGGAPERGLVVDFCGLPGVARGPVAAAHCAAHYVGPEELRRRNPDALFVTGANIPDPDLDRLPHRRALVELLAWAGAEVPTTLYSCLATHAVMHFRHGCRRRALPGKRWGVFPHRITAPGHPLVAGLADGLEIPHSRWNDVAEADFAAAGYAVLIADAQDGGVHLAASPDGRTVLMQGHPEYEPVSLLKEHKREIDRFAAGLRDDCPHAPEHMLEPGAAALLHDHREAVLAACAARRLVPPYPEAAATAGLRDTWRRDTARFFASWLATAGGRTA